MGQPKREGGWEGERDCVRRRGEGRRKGQRNWLREEKYSLEQRVLWNCILRSGFCMCSQDWTYKSERKDKVNNRKVKHAVPQVDFHTLLHCQSTMSVLIVTQLKIDTSTSFRKVRPCICSIYVRPFHKPHYTKLQAWCLWFLQVKSLWRKYAKVQNALIAEFGQCIH